jgi:integrating conjugative element protein (TIGR03755 family)
MRSIIISLSFSLVLVSQTIFADSLLPTKSYDYYQLNGGSDISMPSVSPTTSIDVGGNVNSNLGYTCNGFNPAISISNTINNLSGSIEGLDKSVIGSATTAVGSLPMYELEKMDPKLYNLIQNAITGAQDRFNVSMKSCQRSLAQIKNGKSPYQDWFSISDSNGWMNHAKAAAQGQSVDINAARTDTMKKGPEYGVQWVHKGPSGGSIGDQVPIKVISDIAIAGYNIMIDPSRPLDDDSSPSSVNHSDLTLFWPTPHAAGSFAALILGNMTITTKKSDQAQGTTAGIGLVPILTSCPDIANTDKTCVKTIRDKLAHIVASNDTPSPTDLEQISANGLAITPRVVDGLRNLDKSGQALYINRISQDVAIQNLIDESLMLRRILIAGSQAQVVQNLQPALNAANESIQRLNKDIENLLFEHQVRKQMTSNTMKMLLEEMNNNEENAANQENQQNIGPSTNNGAVYKQRSGE